MRSNKLRALWREGKPATIGWLGTADGFIAEVMAHAGFDAIVVDMQHGMAIGPDRAATVLQVLSTTDVVPLVRVPWNEPIPIQYVLDAGAYGVVVPMVNNREDAVKAAGACRYAPMGYRSNGPNRARFYFGDDYFEHANKEIICLAMIETVEGVENLDAIAQVPGIDGFHIGPTDLAISMGLPPAFDVKDTKWEESVQKVVAAAKKYGLVAGIQVSGPEAAVRRFKQGFNFNPLGSDIRIVQAGAQKLIEDWKKGLAAG